MEHLEEGRIRELMNPKQIRLICCLAGAVACLLGTLLGTASAAITNGDLIRISRPGTSYNGNADVDLAYNDRDRAYGGALLGGEFRIVGAVKADGSPVDPGGEEVFKTFCLEYQEHITIPTNYYATIDDRAIDGGVGTKVGTPAGDPLSTATKWFYSHYRDGNLNTQTGLFQYDRGDWSDALQLIFWRLENEVRQDSWTLTNPNYGSVYGLTTSIQTKATDLWNWYLANDDTGKKIDSSTEQNLGRVQVINLWGSYSDINMAGSNPHQSQLYYGPPTSSSGGEVPEPATFATWSFGLAAVSLVRFMRRRSGREC